MANRSARAKQALLLLAMADSGLFAAPKELLNLRDRLRQVAGLTPEPVPPLADVRRDFVARLANGEQLTPEGMSARVGTVRTAETARQDAIELIGQAELQVEALLTGAVAEFSQVTCSALNEALQKLRGEFRKVAEDFGPFLSLPDTALLATEEKVRQAALQVDELGERVARIYSARDILAKHFGERPQVDLDGLCSTWSNPIEVSGGVGNLRQRRQTAQRPWPKEPRQA